VRLFPGKLGYDRPPVQPLPEESGRRPRGTGEAVKQAGREPNAFGDLVQTEWRGDKLAGRAPGDASGGRLTKGIQMADAKSGAKPKTTPAVLMVPVTPDDVLAKIVGAAPLSRSEVTKKLWDYIKSRGLQDSKNKRNINADEALKAVFGGKAQVNMFEMTSLVNKHIK
jgi:chromatin remodeling complex protein RSC6